MCLANGQTHLSAAQTQKNIGSSSFLVRMFFPKLKKLKIKRDSSVTLFSFFEKKFVKFWKTI
jgi:hypothetical protein